MTHKKHSLNLLLKNKCKITKQRLTLCDIIFDGKNKHFRAEDIKKILRNKKLNISLATIYNNLNFFDKSGMLKSKNLGKISYYDNNINNHYHYYDIENKKLIDIPAKKIKFSHFPKMPRNKKIKNINLIINLENND